MAILFILGALRQLSRNDLDLLEDNRDHLEFRSSTLPCKICTHGLCKFLVLLLDQLYLSLERHEGHQLGLLRLLKIHSKSLNFQLMLLDYFLIFGLCHSERLPDLLLLTLHL